MKCKIVSTHLSYFRSEHRCNCGREIDYNIYQDVESRIITVLEEAENKNQIQQAFVSMNYDVILSHIAQHTQLTKEELDFFISVLEHRTIRKKELLLDIGKICRYDYFINKGCLKICYTDSKGNECITKFAVENWWLVDIDSFLNHNPSFFYFQALEDTDFFQISKENHELLLQKIPALQQFTMERWQNGFIALQNRFMQSVSLSAEEKYVQFKIKYPNLEQRIPLKLIASYLGITPEFLSVLRKKGNRKS